MISELSAVDVPAQQGADIGIRKADEQLSDRIKDPKLSDEEKRKLAMKLNPNYGKGVGFLARLASKLKRGGRLPTDKELDEAIVEALVAQGHTRGEAGVIARRISATSREIADDPKLLDRALGRVDKNFDFAADLARERRRIEVSDRLKLKSPFKVGSKRHGERADPKLKLGLRWRFGEKRFDDPLARVRRFGKSDGAIQAIMDAPSKAALAAAYARAFEAVGRPQPPAVVSKVADNHWRRRLRSAIMLTGPAQIGRELHNLENFARIQLGHIGKNGDMLAYLRDHPEEREAWLERQRAKKRKVSKSRFGRLADLGRRFGSKVDEADPVMHQPSAFWGVQSPVMRSPIRANPSMRTPMAKPGDLRGSLAAAGRKVQDAAGMARVNLMLRQKADLIALEARQLTDPSSPAGSRALAGLRQRLANLRAAEVQMGMASHLADRVQRQFPNLFSKAFGSLLGRLAGRAASSAQDFGRKVGSGRFADEISDAKALADAQKKAMLRLQARRAAIATKEAAMRGQVGGKVAELEELAKQIKNAPISWWRLIEKAKDLIAQSHARSAKRAVLREELLRFVRGGEKRIDALTNVGYQLDRAIASARQRVVSRGLDPWTPAKLRPEQAAPKTGMMSRMEQFVSEQGRAIGRAGSTSLVAAGRATEGGARSLERYANRLIRDAERRGLLGKSYTKAFPRQSNVFDTVAARHDWLRGSRQAEWNLLDQGRKTPPQIDFMIADAEKAKNDALRQIKLLENKLATSSGKLSVRSKLSAAGQAVIESGRPRPAPMFQERMPVSRLGALGGAASKVVPKTRIGRLATAIGVGFSAGSAVGTKAVQGSLKGALARRFIGRKAGKLVAREAGKITGAKGAAAGLAVQSADEIRRAIKAYRRIVARNENIIAQARRLGKSLDFIKGDREAAIIEVRNALRTVKQRRVQAMRYKDRAMQTELSRIIAEGQRAIAELEGLPPDKGQVVNRGFSRAVSAKASRFVARAKQLAAEAGNPVRSLVASQRAINEFARASEAAMTTNLRRGRLAAQVAGGAAGLKVSAMPAIGVGLKVPGPPGAKLATMAGVGGTSTYAGAKAAGKLYDAAFTPRVTPGAQRQLDRIMAVNMPRRVKLPGRIGRIATAAQQVVGGAAQAGAKTQRARGPVGRAWDAPSYRRLGRFSRGRSEAEEALAFAPMRRGGLFGIGKSRFPRKGDAEAWRSLKLTPGQLGHARTGLTIAGVGASFGLGVKGALASEALWLAGEAGAKTQDNIRRFNRLSPRSREAWEREHRRGLLNPRRRLGFAPAL